MLIINIEHHVCACEIHFKEIVQKLKWIKKIDSSYNEVLIDLNSESEIYIYRQLFDLDCK